MAPQRMRAALPKSFVHDERRHLCRRTLARTLNSCARLAHVLYSVLAVVPEDLLFQARMPGTHALLDAFLSGATTTWTTLFANASSSTAKRALAQSHGCGGACFSIGLGKHSFVGYQTNVLGKSRVHGYVLLRTL